MEAVVCDFGDRNPQEDPVIHFYEHFLAAYDKKQKVSRGVFYTPRPVVSYIVRSVDELLRSEFGLADGLADTTTWGEMGRRHKELKIPEGVSPNQDFVQILDPATGTGTFLVEVIDLIYKTLVDKWEAQGYGEREIDALWNEYVPKHLLARLHGYELLMAPYAIAHLKIGLKLYETGYHFANDARVRIYLTNALEPAQDFSGQFQFAIPALAHEARAVSEVKRVQRFTVIVGNPPYSGHSPNRGDWIRKLVAAYYQVDGQPLGEKNTKWLQDDYVKFVRLGEDHIERSTCGIQSFITNHGYLDNPTFRGMRRHLMKSFQVIDVLDLHGNSTKRERCLDGSEDENVFDIKQGVAIFAARRALPSDQLAQPSVRHGDLYGRRDRKYEELQRNSVTRYQLAAIEPSRPFYLFTPQNADVREEYSRYPSIKQVMPVNVLGFQTHRDHFAIDVDRGVLKERIGAFREMRLTDAQVAEEFGLTSNRDWNIHDARRDLRSDAAWERALVKCLYRPFDLRWCYFSTAAMDYPRREQLDHVAHRENLCLGVGRQGIAVEDPVWSLVSISRCPIDANVFRRGGINVFPLWLYREEGALTLERRREPNVSSAFVARMRAALGLSWGADDGVPSGIEPEWIVHYAYAVFHSLSYRSRYAEFLKIDFPRLPLPGHWAAFRVLAHLGEELVALHLLESAALEKPITSYFGGRSPEVEKVSWSGNAVWLDKAQSIGFKGVREELWEFRVGGYQVCEKWLKDRKGRRLSKGDIGQYQKIIVAVSETLRLMKEIDEVIEQHGGWPGAFQTSSAPEAAGAAGADVIPIKRAAEHYQVSKPPVRKVAERRTEAEQDDGDGESSEDDSPGTVADGILELEPNELMCRIRAVFSTGGARSREVAIRDLAASFGHKRLGTRIRRAADNALRTAARRGILDNDHGALRASQSSINDYSRDFLKKQFLASLEGYDWQDREESIQRFGRWMGFRRTGSSIRSVAKSLMNGLIREQRLVTDGPSIRRTVG
jgi:predicted helicase